MVALVRNVVTSVIFYTAAGFINVGVLCDINLGTQALKIASFLDHFPLFIAMPFYESLLQNLAL